MGERACYLAICPNCDFRVSIADEICPDCGSALHAAEPERAGTRGDGQS